MTAKEMFENGNLKITFDWIFKGAIAIILWFVVDLAQETKLTNKAVILNSYKLDDHITNPRFHNNLEDKIELRYVTKIEFEARWRELLNEIEKKQNK